MVYKNSFRLCRWNLLISKQTAYDFNRINELFKAMHVTFEFIWNNQKVSIKFLRCQIPWTRPLMIATHNNLPYEGVIVKRINIVILPTTNTYSYIVEFTTQLKERKHIAYKLFVWNHTFFTRSLPTTTYPYYVDTRVWILKISDI